MNHGRPSTLTRLKRWSWLLVSSLLGQVATQLLNAVSGFLIVRWLTVEAFAQYSLAFAFQTTLSILIDLGFSGAIVALVGERADEPGVVASYLDAARRLRRSAYRLVLPPAGILFLVAGRHQAWPWSTQVALFATVAAVLVFQGWVSCYSAPLLIRRRLGFFYGVQVAAACARLLLLLPLRFTGHLTALSAASVNAVVVGLVGLITIRAAARQLGTSTEVDSDARRTMMRYVAPQAPMIVFAAFQSNLSLLIVTVLAQARTIAEIGALGRVAQLYSPLAALNGSLWGPSLAAQPEGKARTRYLQLAGGGFVAAAVITGLVCVWPDGLLWLLGKKYDGLRAEVISISVAAGLSYLASMLYVFNAARRWVRWWTGALEMGGALSVLVLGARMLDLSLTADVIRLAIAQNVAVLAAHAVTAAANLRRADTPRSI